MLLCRIVGYAPVTIKKWTVRFNFSVWPLHFGSFYEWATTKAPSHTFIHFIHSLVRFFDLSIRFLVLLSTRETSHSNYFSSTHFHFHGSISLWRWKKFQLIVQPKIKCIFSTTTKTPILLLHRRLHQPISRSYFRAECKGRTHNRNRFPIYREKSICVRWKVLAAAVAMCGQCINRQGYQLLRGT